MPHGRLQEGHPQPRVRALRWLLYELRMPMHACGSALARTVGAGRHHGRSAGPALSCAGTVPPRHADARSVLRCRVLCSCVACSPRCCASSNSGCKTRSSSDVRTYLRPFYIACSAEPIVSACPSACSVCCHSGNTVGPHTGMGYFGVRRLTRTSELISPRKRPTKGRTLAVRTASYTGHGLSCQIPSRESSHGSMSPLSKLSWHATWPTHACQIHSAEGLPTHASKACCVYLQDTPDTPMQLLACALNVVL